VAANPSLRHSVRAIVLDDMDRILLCRFDLPTQGLVVWGTPGGGIEAAESPLEALERELHEELGLTLVNEPPHVWHQRVVAEGHAEGYDGVINDYYLIKTDSFNPKGSLGPEILRAENITGFRWWSLGELQTSSGDAIFGPRDLPALLEQLLRTGTPQKPLTLGP
jgi:8-oxo-dGTP diphosphatase